MASPEPTKFQRRTNCDADYQIKYRYNGPKGEVAVWDFIADPINGKGFEQASTAVSDVEVVFLRARDGQPFRVKIDRLEDLE